MSRKTPSLHLRAITRLYKEAKQLLPTDPGRAGLLITDAYERLQARPLSSQFEQQRLGEVLLLLACYELRLSSFDTALGHINRAMSIFENLCAVNAHTEALNVAASLHLRKGEYPAALELLHASLEGATKTGNAALRGQILGNLGIVYWQIGQYDEALRFMQQNLAISSESKAYRSMAGTLLNIGNVYGNNGEDVLALEHFFRGLALLEKHLPDHTLDQSKFFLGIGSVFSRMGEYDQALEYYKYNFDLIEKLGDKSSTASALFNIGLLHRTNSNYEEARDSIQRSLVLYEEMGEAGGTMLCLVNIAGVSLDMHRYGEALEYALRGYQLTTTSGDRRLQSYALHAVGKAHLGLGNYDEAIVRLREGLAVCREIRYSKGEILIGLELGSALQDVNEGLAYILEAFTLVQKIPQKPLLLDVRKALAEIYERRGETGLALEHFKEVYELNNTIYNENSKRRMQVFRVMHQVEEAKKEAEVYRLKTEQLEQKVEEQQRNASTNAILLSRRLDFLYRIKKMLASVLDTLPREFRKEVRQIITVIDSDLAGDESWNVFEEQFRQVQPAFVGILKEQYPELSAVELKVCSLLKLNLSSKEICRILNIAPRSVDVYRYRIRKKLKLSSEANLSTFLAGIS